MECGDANGAGMKVSFTITGGHNKSAEARMSDREKTDREIASLLAIKFFIDTLIIFALLWKI